MTPEDFTTAARVEAERQYGTRATTESRIALKSAHGVGAEWARTYLAEQEPTEHEVHEVAKVLYGRIHSASLDALNRAGQIPWEALATAALTAARAARRDEEKR